MTNKFRSLYRGAKFFKGLLTAELFGKNVPLMVFLHVNNKCNLRCKYCYANYGNRFDKNVKDFSLEEIKNLISELKSMGTGWISFLGGEPLLREDIGEIIRYADKKGMLVELITNGTLVKQRINDITGLDSICFSIDGVGEANDIARGKGTYEKILEGIKVAKEKKLNIRLHAVFTRANMNSLRELAELAKELKVRVGFSQGMEYPAAANSLMQFTKEEYRNLWIEVRKLKKEGYPIYNSYQTLDYVINWPLSYEETCKDVSKFPSNFKPLPCYSGRRVCFIEAEGVVYTCLELGLRKGSNFLEVGFKKAWENAGKDIECKYCGMVQNVECNHLFHLRYNTILTGAKHLLSNR